MSGQKKNRPTAAPFFAARGRLTSPRALFHLAPRFFHGFLAASARVLQPFALGFPPRLYITVRNGNDRARGSEEDVYCEARLRLTSDFRIVSRDSTTVRMMNVLSRGIVERIITTTNEKLREYRRCSGQQRMKLANVRLDGSETVRRLL